MRLHRFLIPLAAGVVIVGVLLALSVVLSRGTPKAFPKENAVVSSPELGELLAMKNAAEALAIAGDLPAAHAKYRELFTLARGREIKEPAFWDLLERAKLDQDRIYIILLSQRDPTRVLTPPLPVYPPATTRSFVDTYPPYPATTRGSATTATTPTTAAAATTPAPAPVATRAVSRPATAVAAINPLAVPEPTRFKVTRTPIDPDGFSDAMIGNALGRANDFLLAQFKEGEIEQGKEVSESYRQGLNALCVYALLHSAQATRDARLAVTNEFMRAALDKMKLHAMATDKEKAQQPLVYARSLRAATLAAAGRPEDRAVLKADVQWLIDAAVDGAYTYDDRFTVRVAPGDGRPVRNLAEPKPPGSDGPKPKTLGPPRDGEPKPVGGGAGARGGSIARDIFALEAPLPIELADGLHDPKTGQELGWPGLNRRYPPPPQAIYYPPQELPTKYDGPFVWDNSNSQYGLLGVAAGADAGIEVPDAYWAAAEQHWLACQLASGQWPYRKDTAGGRLAMTCAGIASLLVTHDALEAPSVGAVGRRPSPARQALANGFAWLEKADNAIDVTGPHTVYLGYSLHALSRVGLASGYKFLGAHDWYRELSRKVVLSQWESGAWGRSDQAGADTLIDTAYTMLFLARGRHPIVMNKLRLDEGGRADRGEWNNRPRDLANLCRFASRELERPLNWQVVSLDRDPADWSDAPILYFASHAALKFSDADVAKIRAFVDAGGLLFTQSDTGSESFNLYVNQFAKRLFPEWELKDLPADHELYTLQYVLAKNVRPRLRGLSNGARLLWVHSPADLAVSWQQRAERSKREAFEMGVNLFVYAAGKSDLRNRIDARAIPQPTSPPSATLPLARLKYAGNWDPEPAAFTRFARYVQWETSLGIKPAPVDIQHSEFTLQNFPIAHLSGTTAFTPTDAQSKALTDYVTAGGTLIVESVGGADSPFADSLQSTLLPKAFPDARFDALPPDHPMLHASFKGMEDVWPPRLRAYAALKLGKSLPAIRMASVGRGRVIYLPLDVTSGLLGSNTWPIFGYEPGEAAAILKNIVLWTLETAGR